jgi:hypothetical protein
MTNQCAQTVPTLYLPQAQCLVEAAGEGQPPIGR